MPTRPVSSSRFARASRVCLLLPVLLAPLLAQSQSEAKLQAAPASLASGNQAWLALGLQVSQTHAISEIGIGGTLRFVHQLPDGCLLLGSTLGAYLYDGNAWTPLAGVYSAYSFLKYHDGRLFIGSSGRILELKRTSPKGWTAESLVDVGGVERLVEDLQETPAGCLTGNYGNGVFFLRLSGGRPELRTHLTPGGFWINGLASLKSGCVAAIFDNGHRLKWLNEDGSESLPSPDLEKSLSAYPIARVLADTNERCWLVCDDGRTLSFDGQTSQLAPWSAANPSLRFTPHSIRHDRKGGFLVGSIELGLFHFDAQGRILGHFSQTEGLPEESVLSSLEDRDDGLWLTTPRHLVRVDAQRRFTEFNEQQGLRLQSIEFTARHGGLLYVAGNEGLFVQNPAATRQEDAFRRVEGVESVHSLLEADDTLWIGDNRLRALHGSQKLVSYETAGVSSLALARTHRDRLVCGTTNGLVVMQRQPDGRWAQEVGFPTRGKLVYGLGELGEEEFWGQLGTGSVLRLRRLNGSWDLRFLDTSDGLPERWIDLGIVEGQLIAPGEGQFEATRWDEAQGRFLPTKEFSFYADNLGPHVYHPVFYRQNGEALIRPNVKGLALQPRVPKVALSAIQQVTGSREECASGAFIDEDGSTWICHSGGVLRCAPGIQDSKPALDILAVSLIRDIHSGSTLSSGLHKGDALCLGPEQNWLHVEAALAEYRSSRFALFKLWLEGFDDQGALYDKAEPQFLARGHETLWTRSPSRDFTNLPCGYYRLHVSALDGMGLRREELIIPIRIREHWYSTLWAKLGYALAFTLSLMGLVRVRGNLLKRSNERLSELVEQKTLELKRAHDERIQLERSIQQAQRLDSLGILAGGIAHDFNNLLTVIMGNNSILQLDTKSGTQTAQMLQQSQEAAEEAASLCRQMLAYAGHGRYELRAIHLGDLVKSTTAMLRTRLPSRLTVLLDLAEDLPSIRADAFQLQQLLGNLLQNAAEASDGHATTVIVRTSLVHSAPTGRGELMTAPEKTDYPLVGLEIIDDGPGIAPDKVRRIFEPFFTSKAVGRGLGLSAVLGTVRSHHGLLHLRSEKGQGCHFTILLPRDHQSPNRPRGTKAPFPLIPARRARILLADDEASVRLSVARMLTELGHDCRQTHQGEEALHCYLENPGAFDLVILDMIMPGLNGLEVMEAILERNPSQACLLISGFNPIDRLPFQTKGRQPRFLQKPFDLEQLRESIANLLIVS